MASLSTPNHKGRWAAWRRELPRLSALVAIGGVLWVTISQLHPELLLNSSITTGGDTGAHVALPEFLRSSLLSHGHLTGWYPGWYDGFPLYTFYFVFPDLLAALGSYVVSYGVAFKMATIAGSVAMPFAAYGLGRLFRLRAPLPSALAVATLPFLFDPTFTIDGGNLFSTLAGEYAFSLSLALSLLVIGLFARGVEEGKGGVVTPVVMALCLGSHLVPFLYAGLGALAVTLIALLPRTWLRGDDSQGNPAGLLGRSRLGRPQALWWSVRTGLIGLGLSAWWFIPFVANQGYTNPMGYTNDTDYLNKLFPSATIWVAVLAGLGAILAIRLASRFAITFIALALVSALAFVVVPQGSLWNERILPLWYLSLYLIGAWMVGYLVAALVRWIRRERLERSFSSASLHRRRAHGRTYGWLPAAVGGPVALLALAILVVLPPMVPDLVAPSTLKAVGVTVGSNQVSSWAQWNYSGYEAKPAYPEYQTIMKTMGSLAGRYGCGRAMWEYSSSLDRFGTPMALMLLPYWTNNCVGSQEGLFFESSATVPYHFLIQAEVSAAPSNPQVNLPYSAVNVPMGVAHLQMLGVKYLMTSSPTVTAAADKTSSLTKLTTIGPFSAESGGSPTTWSIYLIHDAPLVVGLKRLPIVVPGIEASSDTWKNINVTWFEQPYRWDSPLAASGPANWPRGSGSTSSSPAVTPAKITKIVTSSSSVSFDVDRVGVPVEVRVSYYPRWHVQGATGPYRISPDLMAVVPTRHHVVLSYGSDPSTTTGVVATMLSVLCLGAVAWIPRWSRRKGAHRRR